MPTSETRPDLDDLTSAEAFRRWYWLKAELVAYCTSKGISTAGGKFALADRIAVYLDTGTIIKPAARPPTRSRFNWASAPLSRETIITDNVTFGNNFRGFMHAQIGSAFVCHSDFMDWVKANIGATLADAVAAWHALEDRKRDSNFKREIAPQYARAVHARFLCRQPPRNPRRDDALLEAQKSLAARRPGAL